MAANASIAGFSLAALAATDPGRLATALIRVLDHLLAGRLDFDLTLVDDLAHAPDAQQALADGRGHGKHVVDLVSSRGSRTPTG